MSNRAELRTLTSSFCEDPSQTKFTVAKYSDSLETAQKQFCLDTKSLYKTQAYVMAVDDADYDLPTDFISDKLVMLNGIELEPISRSKLAGLFKSQRWDTQEGTPKYYVIDPMEAKKQLLLVPIPDSIADGTSLELTYSAIPTTMATDAATPFNSSVLMTQFHIAVASYAAWLLLGYLTPTDPIISKRRDLLNTYTGKVNEAIASFGDTKSEPMSLHPESIRVR